MPEPVRYRNKGTHSGTGMLRYRTEIQDAGMPMPAASTSMPMPSYGKRIQEHGKRTDTKAMPEKGYRSTGLEEIQLHARKD
jgi:hypothetical protein